MSCEYRVKAVEYILHTEKHEKTELKTRQFLYKQTWLQTSLYFNDGNFINFQMFHNLKSILKKIVSKN